LIELKSITKSDGMDQCLASVMVAQKK